jgi:Tfp pilus assembly protein PilE
VIPAKKHTYLRCKGAALILSMIFVLIFSALAGSMAAVSGANAQLASNRHKVNSALLDAQSGLECGRYIVSTVSLEETPYNVVTDAQAGKVWADLCQHLQNVAPGGAAVPCATRFNDLLGSALF